MNMPRIHDAQALDAAFLAETFLLFKHSTRCPTSAWAFAEYESFIEAHPDVPTAWIDVVQDRALSLEVARRADVVHQSPQAIVLAHGHPTWHASHGAVTQDALLHALGLTA